MSGYEPIPKRHLGRRRSVGAAAGLYQTARALPIGLKGQLEAADRTVGARAGSGFFELRPMNPTADDLGVIEVDGLRTVRLQSLAWGTTLEPLWEILTRAARPEMHTADQHTGDQEARSCSALQERTS